MLPILVLDAGNSRLKWGLFVPPRWQSFGATPNAEIGTLALREWQNLARPARAVGINVAGEPVRLRIEALLARWRVTPEWMGSSAAACGVTNGYEAPEQLGADRWASLVAARRRVTAGGAAARPAVVVNAGTAVTIDALDADGRFRGGMILPGVNLMLHALADKTSALRVAAGRFRDFPTNTADAMYSGAVQAICGAIARSRDALRRGDGDVLCLLSGGAAPDIAPHLGDGAQVAAHLVLEGVLALAGVEAAPVVAS